jgi:SAM-dependent methyltransferase
MVIDWRHWRRVLRTARKLASTLDNPGYSEFCGVFPLHFPPLDIELDARPDQLARMLHHIGRRWSKMGEDWPHFSVLSYEQYLPRNLAGSIDDFWAAGRAEAGVVTALLDRLGFGDRHERICVEYGCGVGRVTIPLAEQFAELHAYDISANHLSLARQRAETAGVGNIRFHHRGNGVLEALAPCDFFYSRLVFQHNPPPIMRELVRLSLASLRPGGVAIFEIPVYLAGYRFHIDDYLDNPPKEPMEMHCLPQREVFSLAAAAGCVLIEVREDRTIETHRECLGNLFVIGRPAAP